MFACLSLCISLVIYFLLLSEDNSTSDSDHDDSSDDSTDQTNQKSLQEDVEYRNYVIREFQSNLESKNPEHNGFESPTKKDIQKSQENKFSLLEKRLLGKKVTEDDFKSLHKKSKSILENGNKKKSKERYDEDPTQNSSKRTVYVNSNDPSLCEICLKVWPAKKHLWQHYIRCHKQTAATVCGICLKTNDSYASLQAHLRETHPNLLHGCGFGSNFICKICGRYHNASSKLKLHMAIHVGFTENILQETEKTENVESMDKNEVMEITEPEILEDLDVIKVEVKEENQENEEINYENMIEEVEVYSDFENDNDNENVEDFVVNESEINDVDYSIENEQDDNVSSPKQSDLSSESSDNESDNEISENDLEKEMLKNMLGENVIVTKQEFVDSNEELSFHSNNVEIESYDVKMDLSDDWTNSPSQTKELDNAVRSISYENEMEIVCLTEAELETAVGSIL